ncbi:MAG: tripartite tricarboxylate transporter TctB family protein [Ideonella sp.]|nr:tripartite tricarboxylate transporter TctB family protein [Ideonella sp.]MCC7457208.1 tripartite tricarboxylate transporter TctB family protein [Nitrospira sp.]
MKLNDAVFGALFLALSLLVLWTIGSYPKIPGQNIGPAAFPGVAASVLALCSLLLIVQGLRARSREASPWWQRGEWTTRPAQLIAFAVTVGGLLLYVLASERIGFIATGIVMLGSLMLALRVRLAAALIVAVASTLVIHFAFYKGLRVPLPWGVLPVLY